MSSSSTATPPAQAPFTAKRWQQFWAAWKAEPQQLEGIEQLRLAVIVADPAILTECLTQIVERKQERDFPWFPARVVCHDILG